MDFPVPKKRRVKSPSEPILFVCFFQLYGSSHKKDSKKGSSFVCHILEVVVSGYDNVICNVVYVSTLVGRCRVV